MTPDLECTVSEHRMNMIEHIGEYQDRVDITIRRAKGINNNGHSITHVETYGLIANYWKERLRPPAESILPPSL